MKNGMVYTKGQRLRDQGIKQVSGHNKQWMEKAVAQFRRKPPGIFPFQETFTGEDIRFYLEACAMVPPHPNIVGALVRTLIARKLIVKTGRYVMPKDSSSHGRMIQEYRRA